MPDLLADQVYTAQALIDAYYATGHPCPATAAFLHERPFEAQMSADLLDGPLVGRRTPAQRPAPDFGGPAL